MSETNSMKYENQPKGEIKFNWNGDYSLITRPSKVHSGQDKMRIHEKKISTASQRLIKIPTIGAIANRQQTIKHYHKGGQ